MANAYFDLAAEMAKKVALKAQEATRGAKAITSEIAQEIASAHHSGAIGAGSSAMQGYRLLSVAHSTTCGPMDCWKVYDATSKKPHAAAFKDVSVWVLDKKALMDALARGGGGGGGGGGGVGQARGRPLDPFLEQQRRGCTLMTRIRHPGIIRVIEPMEETHSSLVMITERVVASLKSIQEANLHPQPQPQPQTQPHNQNQPQSQSNIQSQSNFQSNTQSQSNFQSNTQHQNQPGIFSTPGLSPLESRLGLSSLAETLAFLHEQAHVAHCGLSPGVVMVDPQGSWKLAGFSFAFASSSPPSPSSSSSSSSTSSTPSTLIQYDYSDPFPPLPEELAKPLLPYTAPELIRGLPSSQISVNPDPSFHTCANADVFSFAAIAFELLGNAYDAKASTSPPSSSSSSLSSPAAAATTAIRQLLPVRNNLNDYRVRLAWLLGQSSNPSPSPSPSLLSSSSSSRDPFQTLSTASSNSLSLAPPSSVSASNGNTSPLVIQMGAFGSFLLPLIQPLSSSYPARPSPSLIATHGLLMEDIRVRAIKFIEGLIQRDLTQKINFFNDLSGATKSQTIGGGGGGGMWQGIDERLLALRLAPAMIEELRSNGPEELQCALLPTLIAILAKLASYISPSSSSLPSSSSSSPSPSPSSHPLGPTVNELLSSFSRALADSIKGPTALALTVKHARSISSLFSSDTTASCLIPLVLKALEGPPQLQEDALGSLSVLGPSLEYSCLKNAMPRIHSLCLETTAAPIRCKCLLLLGQCSSRLDKDEADKILATISRVTGADRSLGTLRCSFKACEDVSNQWGAEVTAERILPLLSPLLLSPSLVVANDQPQPLNEVVSVVKGMVDRIHAKMMPKPGSSIGTGSGQAQGINSSNGLGSSGGVKKPAAPTAWDTYQAPVPSSSSSGLGGIVSGGGAGGWDFTSTSKPPPSQSMATASLSDAAVYSSSTQGQAAVKAPTISVVSASSVMSQLKPHASPATSSATATASTTTSQPHAPHPLPPNLVIPSASYPSRQVQPLNFPQPTSSPAVASRQLPDMFSNVDPSSSLNPHSLSATKMTMGVPGNGMSTRASEPPASANGYMFSGMNVAAAAQAPAPAANPTAIATKPVFDPFGTSKPLITNADNSLI